MVNKPRDFDYDILNQIRSGNYDNFNSLRRKLKMDPTKLKERLDYLRKNKIVKKYGDPKGELTKVPNSYYYAIINDIEKKPVAIIEQ